MTTTESGEKAEKRSAPSKVTHLTTAERVARGKAARAETPRSSHAAWEPPAVRADPVDVLEEAAKTRVPELVPIRYGRMLVSPFTFYRGAADLMAADLAGTPRSGLRVQLCGDAHLSNFGGFAAPDRSIVFDINDFDETLPGPWEWDVKRLVTSFEVAARDRGFSDQERDSLVLAVAGSYRKAMHDFAAMGNLDIWYSRLDVSGLISRWGSEAGKQQRKTFDRTVAKARTKDSMRAFKKLTHLVDGEPRIVSDPPLIVPIEELLPEGEAHRFQEALEQTFRSYRRSLQHDRRHLLEGFRFVDAARKVVGVGSVGTRAWIILVVGRDNDDPLFLQMKEAGPSVLEPFTGKSEFAQHGQRVVQGQRLMQAASDIMLGWLDVTGIDDVKRDFYMRQLWDSKVSADVETMVPKGMGIYAQVCAWTLARAHARTGDAIAIAAYLGNSDSFDRAVATFAAAYANQNERDYKALTDAVATGRIEAQTGL